MPSIRRLFSFLGKAIAALALFALVTSAVFFLLIRHEHNTPLTLPQPSGRFAVGRVTYAWTNSAAPDELSPIRGAPRQLMVWIWYPAAPRASGAPAPYVPAAWRAAIAPHGSMAFVTRNLALVRAHSVSGAPVARDDRSYPVVIMRAGGGAPTTDFTTLAEDLASHGYVVVGFDAAYRTYAFMLPDGRIVDRPPGNDPEDLNPEQADHLINKLLPMWTSDAAFVADQLQQLNAGDPTGRFTGRLDLDQLGMFGHSFGGAQALQFCHDDVRCKAGIDIDGAPYGSVVRDGVKEPFMIVLSDHSREMGDPASRQIAANLQSIYSRLPNGGLLITIRGANHFSFSDQILLKSGYLVGILQAFGTGHLAPRRGLAITADYVHTFFDVYLKRTTPVTALDRLSSKYPEVRVAAQ